MVGWIIVGLLLAAVLGVLGTVVEVALELMLGLVLLVALVVVGGYLLVRSKAGDRGR